MTDEEKNRIKVLSAKIYQHVNSGRSKKNGAKSKQLKDMTEFMKRAGKEEDYDYYLKHLDEIK